ncbi:membrane protein [Microtetraspora sp. NBRC 13810]|uniref:EamA family transporter n=1 Tax=Microtetraspora sp. NBRC 13810 TaxID=3030990 RepID=UPI0024A32D69|nr:DMT family transporter [Microtetraspora sp. NBRC 13810]GLW07519.1 membrane protein [Microtetraspora sp. NBRC 13810]
MRKTGLAIAVTSAWCFAFSGPMAKFLGAAGLAPIEAVWIRMTGAGLLLVAVLAVFRPRALRIPKDRLLFTAAYGLIAIAAVQALFFQAITRLPVGVTLLIEYTAPVMVVLWVRFVRRIRVPRSAYLGAVVAVVGLGIVVEVWQGLRLDGVGLLLAFAAAGCCAGYFLLSDAFGDDVDPLGLIAWGLVGSAVVLVPLSRPWNIDWAVLSRTATLDGTTLPVAGAALWLILVATVLGYITGVTAVRRLSAAVGSTVATLEVIAGAIVAWVLVGEALGGFQIVGGLIVIGGALLAQTATARLPHADGPVVAPEAQPAMLKAEA